jgi:hypothetical protein
MIGQAIADRRATKRTERKEHDKQIADDVAELRRTVNGQGLTLARIEGIVTKGKIEDVPADS